MQTKKNTRRRNKGTEEGQEEEEEEEEEKTQEKERNELQQQQQQQHGKQTTKTAQVQGCRSHPQTNLFWTFIVEAGFFPPLSSAVSDQLWFVLGGCIEATTLRCVSSNLSASSLLPQ